MHDDGTVQQRDLRRVFPKTSVYNPLWIKASASGGAHPLWLAEWLSNGLQLNPGMNVLDLGCGRAASSIFLAREFQVNVWATDLWFDPTENLRRVRDAGIVDRVFPIRADARKLPFATEFFDAIIALDSMPYFGTDDHFLPYLARFVKPGGAIAMAGAGFVDELEPPYPQHLSSWIAEEPLILSMHSADWWRRHWQKTGIVDVESTDHLPDGWQLWLEWHYQIAPDNHIEIQALKLDQGSHLTFNRMVSRRRSDVQLHDPVESLPFNYTFQDLLSGKDG